MEKILLCTDGSEYSQVCARYAAFLARDDAAAVKAAYVTDLRQFEIPLISDLSGSLGIQPYQDMMGQLKEMESAKAKAIEENTRTIFAETNQEEKLEFIHRTGLLVDALEDLEKDADLVLLGKRGENVDFATEHLGSTMERVVRASTKPCLVTSRSFQRLTKLLIAYDGGKSSRKAVTFLAKHPFFKTLPMHLVLVVEDPKGEDLATQQLREAEEILRSQDVESLTCQLLYGTPEDTIGQYVLDEEIDFLVMGAYGHSRIRNLFIGSTTTEMIRRCKVPVLLFR